jgi:hypothetical protein
MQNVCRQGTNSTIFLTNHETKVVFNVCFPSFPFAKSLHCVKNIDCKRHYTALSTAPLLPPLSLDIAINSLFSHTPNLCAIFSNWSQSADTYKHGRYSVKFEVFTAVTMKNFILGMRRRVALIRTGVTEECIASIIRMERISDLGITLAVTTN